MGQTDKRTDQNGHDEMNDASLLADARARRGGANPQHADRRGPRQAPDRPDFNAHAPHARTDGVGCQEFMASSAMSVRARERRQPRHHRHVLKVSVLARRALDHRGTALLGSNHSIQQPEMYGLGLGALAANVFGFAPECHNCAPSELKQWSEEGFSGKRVRSRAEFSGPGRVGSALAAVSHCKSGV